jgi:trk system potassium uptake protein TrkA
MPNTLERVTVIGLGRFGTSLARTLHELGYEVTAIDISERAVAESAEFVTLAAQGDGTDEELLYSLHVDRSEVAVVAQGESLEASVLTTLILKKLNVPWVIAKAVSDLHGDLLRRIGADRIVFPEIDAGVRLAHSISVRHVTDYIPLGRRAGVAKLIAPPHFVGRTVDELNPGQRLQVSVLVIGRGERLIVSPGPGEHIQASDELVLVGADHDLRACIEGSRA